VQLVCCVNDFVHRWAAICAGIALALAPRAIAFRPRPVSDLVRGSPTVMFGNAIASNGSQIAVLGFDSFQMFAADGTPADAPIPLPGYGAELLAWTGHHYLGVLRGDSPATPVRFITISRTGEIEELGPTGVFPTRLVWNGERALLRGYGSDETLVRFLDADGNVIESASSLPQFASVACATPSGFDVAGDDFSVRLDPHGRVISRSNIKAFDVCSMNGNRVLYVNTLYVDSNHVRLVTSVLNGSVVEHTTETLVGREYQGLTALEPDGSGWRAIRLGQFTASVVRFDADGQVRASTEPTECCGHSLTSAAAWSGDRPFVLWNHHIREEKPGAVARPLASDLNVQESVSLVGGDELHLASWIEATTDDVRQFLFATRLDRNGRFLDGSGLCLGQSEVPTYDSYDELPTPRWMAWNGREFAVPNGQELLIVTPAGDSRKLAVLDFSASAVAWNGAQWGVAGTSDDGSLMFAVVGADGAVTGRRALAIPGPLPSYVFVEKHRQPALLWDGVQFVVAWVRHQFHSPTSVGPPYYYVDDRVLFRLRLDRDGSLLDRVPYRLDDVVNDPPAMATNDGEDIIVWGGRSIESARFSAAASHLPPRRLAIGEGASPAIARSGNGFLVTWLRVPLDHHQRREVVRLGGDSVTVRARVPTNETESVHESAIDDTLILTLSESTDTGHLSRAGVIALDDAGAPVPPSPPLALTVSTDGAKAVLRWSPDPSPLFFSIERRNAAGVYCEIAVVPAGTSEARVDAADASSYRLRAWNSAGKSVPSNEAAP
jgi:hypothetical protein